MTNVKGNSKVKVVGKHGSYSIPTRLLSVPQKPKQEHLYNEYWEAPAEFVIKIWENK